MLFDRIRTQFDLWFRKGDAAPVWASGPSPAPAIRQPLAPVVPVAAFMTAAAHVSGFSASRPVVVREDLFGREPVLRRMNAWLAGKSGSVLLYGPRGYGKTSLARVVGEIADTRGHVVIYASCSSGALFPSLIRPYLEEALPPDELPAIAKREGGTLSIQAVAAELSAYAGPPLLFILDEYDRIESEETRGLVVELIKDIADLNAPVQFLLVGVAADAADILGYHPSINRCVTCVPLTRLDPGAAVELFRLKAGVEGLDPDDEVVTEAVRIAAGSAYHLQLIGQKLVEFGGGDRNLFACALQEMIDDAIRMDARLKLLATQFHHDATRPIYLRRLAQAALGSRDDLITAAALETEMPTYGRASDHSFAAYRDWLVAASVLAPVEIEEVGGVRALRFTNAFAPQLILALDYLAED